MRTALSNKPTIIAMAKAAGRNIAAVALFAPVLIVASGIGMAQVITDPAPVIFPLTGVQPIEADILDYVYDQKALRQLGKAFFWDIQAGVDGQACASCHFHAGADIRVQNQVNPGMAQRIPGPDKIFGTRRDKSSLGPNAKLTAADFPFFDLAAPANRDSAIKFETNDVMSSAGVFSGFPVSRTPESARLSARGAFHSRLVRQATSPYCNTSYDQTNNPFHANGIMHRKVADRQSPSVINAIFNYRNFWDGRANNQFNGVDPLGPRTNIASAKAGLIVDVAGTPWLEKILISNASLASQALGPPLSSFEMACEGRTFADVARRLLSARPLSQQTVLRSDSLFGQTAGLVDSSGRGLKTTYRELIKKAFDPKYWRASAKYTVDDFGAVQLDQSRGYTQLEHNFSFFWGIALMEYQGLLISDRTPFDSGALTVEAKRGQTVFSGKGKCILCHGGPVFTAAAQTARDPALFAPVEQMVTPEGRLGVYDAGFYNIGVRPTREDLGVGATDPYGTTFSFSRQLEVQLKGLRVPDEIDVKFCEPEPPSSGGGGRTEVKLCTPTPTNFRSVVDGAFKTPTLRNVGLNPPYMHNGGFSTLEQVVDFYNRGGNRRQSGCGDTTGFGADCANFHPLIQPLGLSAKEKSDLVAFLKSLSDERVACHSGPFDHPSLPLVVGHTYPAQKPAVPVKANDIKVTLPAVGEAGLKAQNLPCFPNTGNLFGDMQTVFSRIAK